MSDIQVLRQIPNIRMAGNLLQRSQGMPLLVHLHQQQFTSSEAPPTPEAVGTHPLKT